MKDDEEKYYGWKVHKPEWENYSHQICTEEHHWTGLYGSSFFLNDTEDRIMFDYPNIAEHFYYLYWDTGNDAVFGSYDLEEVKRFIEFYHLKKYYIYDAVVDRVVESSYSS